MRIVSLIAAALVFASTALSQDLEVLTRPDAVYVENMEGNITPMDRVFIHIVVHNQSRNPVTIDWIRFDMTNSDGIDLSGQYSGKALMNLFDSAIDRHRIEPTPKNTLELYPDQRKAISDIFFDCPAGMFGESVVVEVQYQIGGKTQSNKISSALKRSPVFSGRLPFDGVWYVASEHGFLDPHKRYLAEAYAYDFVQIGANGKSRGENELFPAEINYHKGRKYTIGGDEASKSSGHKRKD